MIKKETDSASSKLVNSSNKNNLLFENYPPDLQESVRDALLGQNRKTITSLKIKCRYKEFCKTKSGNRRSAEQRQTVPNLQRKENNRRFPEQERSIEGLQKNAGDRRS